MRRLWSGLAAAIVIAGPVVAQGVPDDSPAAREAAIARLRAAAPREVCADAGVMSRTFGTTCASREFPAPPILSAPKIAWDIKPGWWGAWSPFLVGNLVLTGSCNNDGAEGVSALDTKTGKFVWRIASVCAVGNRRGSMGQAAFHDLPGGQVLLVYARENGEPTDHYVIDPKAGRIVKTLTPAQRGTLRGLGERFTVLNQSNANGYSYITALSPGLDQVAWRNADFRLAMPDNLDPRYKPTFSPPALAGGVLFQTARSKDQPDPPTRQVQAIDMQTGKTLWRHTAQPVTERTNTSTGIASYRSDDGTPMVAGGKVIIKVTGLAGPVSVGRPPAGDGLRALDARTGAVLWTAPAGPGQTIMNRVAAGPILVTEATSGAQRQLWGVRLADGRVAWRRPVSAEARLLVSSGGAFYVSERQPSKDYRLSGLDGETGTLLWTTALPGHNLDLEGRWGIEDGKGGNAQGPSWRIGRDGAIYGVKLDGAFKLQ